jgi:hypothetical protein
VCAEINTERGWHSRRKQKGSSLIVDLRKHITTHRSCETHAISVIFLPNCEISGLGGVAFQLRATGNGQVPLLHRLTISSERGYATLLNLARVQMLARFRWSSRRHSRTYSASPFSIPFIADLVPTDFCAVERCHSSLPCSAVEMRATMRTSVCYKMAMLGEQYETCCSICQFENTKKHQH